MSTQIFRIISIRATQLKRIPKTGIADPADFLPVIVEVAALIINQLRSDLRLPKGLQLRMNID